MNKLSGYLKLLIIISLVCLTDIAQAVPPLIFNGNNLDGWYAYTKFKGKVSNANEIFIVENGEIKLQGNDPGYIATNNIYSDFKLTLEFCWEIDSAIIDKAKKRNSGVMYLVPDNFKDTLWPKGIQFQVKENCTGDFILLQNTTLKVNGVTNEPGRSVVIKKFKDAEKNVGEWNKIEIVSLNGKCSQYLNGILVNEGDEASVKNGRILLQFEGYPIKFRNINCLEL